MIKKCALFFFCISLFNSVSAKVLITPTSYFFVKGEKPYFDVTAVNTGKAKAYVNVVLQDDTENNKKPTVVEDMGKSMLLISPRRFVILPKQKKIVRINLVKTRLADKEKHYIAVFKQMRGKAVIHDADTQNQENLKTAISLNISYGTRIFVEPDRVKPSLSIKREAKKLTIKNLGNVTARVGPVKQCIDQKDCQSLSLRNLVAPNRMIQFDLPRSLPVQIHTQIAGKVKVYKTN